MTINRHTTSLNADFANVLDIIQGYRSKAIQTINHASVMTAWHVGAYVSNKIKNAQWGAKVVQQLAEYIHTQDPTLKGWSKVTIYRMVKLYDTYSSQQFVSYINKLPKNILVNSQQFVSPKMTQIEQSQIVSAGMTQIPNLLLRIGWTNHQIILQRCTTIDQYIFYILYAEYEHLQNKELERAIKADTYSRMLSDNKWQSEMLKATYPQTQLLLKDKAILEFYLEALDQTERRSNENPSIGILMCKDANSEVVRYALNRSMSPTMVAMYEEHLKVGSVLQRSLEEFTDFLARI